MYFTDDPILDAHKYIEEQEEMLDKLPKCCECGESIQDEKAYYINDEWICESCMSSYKRTVNDYLE